MSLNPILVDHCHLEQICTAIPKLNAGWVHIWQLCFEERDWPYEKLGAILSADEQGKAGRFLSEETRQLYVLRHAFLRLLISGYLGIEPASLVIQNNHRGKPLVNPFQNPQKLNFNVSHSGDLAVIAFLYANELGVDVEEIQPIPDMLLISEKYFSPKENQGLKELPKDQQPWGFFRCWTRKEAYAKAIGLGMSTPFNDFSVSFDPDNPAEFLEINWSNSQAKYWGLEDIPTLPEYIASLCFPRKDLHFTNLIMHPIP